MRADRIGHIGASQVAACLGLSTYETPEQARKGILAGTWEESKPLSPSWWGHRLEDDIIVGLEEWLHSEDGFSCQQATVERWERPSLIHPYYPWLGATPDALVHFPGGLALGECKAPLRALSGPESHQWSDPDESLPLTDWTRWGIPVVYAVQAMTQLGVARACGESVEWCFVAALGLQFVPFDVWTVEYSDEAWSWILDRLVPWYVRHIQNRQPCPPHTLEEAGRGRRPVRTPVRVTARIEQLLVRRCDLKDTAAQVDKEIEAIDCQVLATIRDGAVLYGPSGKIGTWDRSFRPDPKWRQRWQQEP